MVFFFLGTPVYAGKLQGTASYYSYQGCLGCNEGRIMKNGERLDDTKYTIALTPFHVRKYQLLNKMVTVINLQNNKAHVVKVTDTGGFAKYHRIADLGLVVKQSIECSDLCTVMIVW